MSEWLEILGVNVDLTLTQTTHLNVAENQPTNPAPVSLHGSLNFHLKLSTHSMRRLLMLKASSNLLVARSVMQSLGPDIFKGGHSKELKAVYIYKLNQCFNVNRQKSINKLQMHAAAIARSETQSWKLLSTGCSAVGQSRGAAKQKDWQAERKREAQANYSS